MDTSAKPTKIKDLLATPDKWTQGAFARDKFGGLTVPASKRACSFCLYGALEACHDRTSREFASVLAKLTAAIKERTGNPYVVEFNDNPTTTFEDVKRLVEELDI